MHNPWPLVSNAKDTEEAGASPPSLGRSLAPGLLCPGLLSSILPGFSASACPGLLTRVALSLGQQPSRGWGRGELGQHLLCCLDPSVSAARTTEATLPPPGPLSREACPISALPPRLGPAGFLMRRALVSVEGAPPRSRSSRTSASSQLIPHSPPHRNSLPGNSEKGIELKPGGGGNPGRNEGGS